MCWREEKTNDYTSSNCLSCSLIALGFDGTLGRDGDGGKQR